MTLVGAMLREHTIGVNSTFASLVTRFCDGVRGSSPTVKEGLVMIEWQEHNSLQLDRDRRVGRPLTNLGVAMEGARRQLTTVLSFSPG